MNECAPVLALDIGNVCLKVEIERFLSHFNCSTMEEYRLAYPDLRAEKACHMFECGKLSRSAFLDELAATMDGEMTHAEAVVAWNDLIGDEIPGMADIVGRACDAGLKVVFLSDICPIHYQRCCDVLSFTDRVSGAVVSYEVGEMKPHEAMYIALERDHCGGKPPLLYADDREGNVDAARERGWPAYHFGDVQGLSKRMDEQLETIGE